MFFIWFVDTLIVGVNIMDEIMDRIDINNSQIDEKQFTSIMSPIAALAVVFIGLVIYGGYRDEKLTYFSDDYEIVSYKLEEHSRITDITIDAKNNDNYIRTEQLTVFNDHIIYYYPDQSDVDKSCNNEYGVTARLENGQIYFYMPYDIKFDTTKYADKE